MFTELNKQIKLPYSFWHDYYMNCLELTSKIFWRVSSQVIVDHYWLNTKEQVEQLGEYKDLYYAILYYDSHQNSMLKGLCVNVPQSPITYWNNNSLVLGKPVDHIHLLSGETSHIANCFILVLINLNETTLNLLKN